MMPPGAVETSGGATSKNAAPEGSVARERPILFSAPMVRALLDGRKTQTRRVIKGAPVAVVQMLGRDDRPTGDYGLCLTHDRVIDAHRVCPYGTPGDTLWVRETHALIWPDEFEPERPEDNRVEYRADTNGNSLPGSWPDEERGNPDCPHWRPSIHMPRWASRIALRITSVRVERLNDISEADAMAEGCEPLLVPPDGGSAPYTEGYRALWDVINGPGSWDANPWVWVVSFQRITAPADAEGHIRSSNGGPHD